MVGHVVCAKENMGLFVSSGVSPLEYFCNDTDIEVFKSMFTLSCMAKVITVKPVSAEHLTPAVVVVAL